MNIIETRPVTCPTCRITVKMAVDFIRGSHAILFCCPNCAAMMAAENMIGKGAFPGSAAPFDEAEVNGYRQQVGGK